MDRMSSVIRTRPLRTSASSPSLGPAQSPEFDARIPLSLTNG